MIQRWSRRAGRNARAKAPTFEFRGFQPNEVDRFNDAISGIRRSAEPLRVGVYDNLLMTRVSPGRDSTPIGGLFDSNRLAVEESKVERRGEGLVIGVWPGEPDGGSEFVEKAIYGGVLFGGFGHVILESACRLWAAKDYPDLPIVFQTMPKNDAGRFALLALAELLDIPAERFRFFTDPVRIGHAVVPQPGLSLGYEINDRYLEFVRTHLRDLPPEQASRRIYLSRSALHWRQRKAVGEAQLDAALEAAGVKVLHPESMTLSEQIAAHNGASAVAGFIGSQFHTLFLRASTKPIDILYLCSSRPNVNFFQIDMLFPGRRIYSNVAEYDPVFEFGNRSPFYFSPDATRRALRDLGIRLPAFETSISSDFVYDWAIAYFHFKVFRRGLLSGDFGATASGRMRDMLAKLTRPFSAAESEQVLNAYFEVARRYRVLDDGHVIAAGKSLRTMLKATAQRADSRQSHPVG